MVLRLLTGAIRPAPDWRLLTNAHIKWLAAVCMVVDHAGYIFFPDEELFRVIGRVSFPLFAWLLVQGEAHTRHYATYLVRLLGLGLISQPIYQLAFRTDTPNILFTLALGLVGLRVVRAYPKLRLPVWVAAAAVAAGASLDYGAYGMAVIALMSLYRTSVLWWGGWVALHGLLFATQPWYGGFQLPAMAAALILPAANLERGARAGWFYAFYPLHLLVIYLLARWL